MSKFTRSAVTLWCSDTLRNISDQCQGIGGESGGGGGEQIAYLHEQSHHRYPSGCGRPLGQKA